MMDPVELLVIVLGLVAAGLRHGGGVVGVRADQHGRPSERTTPLVDSVRRGDHPSPIPLVVLGGPAPDRRLYATGYLAVSEPVACGKAAAWE
jgi:hypothetical protein